METKYNCTGFLKDASYSAHLYGFMRNYIGSFGKAEQLTLNLIEILAVHAGKFNTKVIDISEDGKKITINIEEFKYTDTKGKVTGKPSPQEVFQTLKFVFDSAVKEYADKFKPENGES